MYYRAIQWVHISCDQNRNLPQAFCPTGREGGGVCPVLLYFFLFFFTFFFLRRQNVVPRREGILHYQRVKTLQTSRILMLDYTIRNITSRLKKKKRHNADRSVLSLIVAIDYSVMVDCRGPG